MNRKSLFARFAAKCAASRTASRQEYFRVQIEPLEARKLLTATHYVSEKWIDTTDPDGTIGYSPSDTLQDPVTGTFANADSGIAFGKINYYNTLTGAWLGTTHDIINSASANLSTIHSAIQASGLHDTVQLEPTIDGVFTGNVVSQTFKESDVVINQGITLQGDGSHLATPVTLAPDIASSNDESAFSTGSHQGIIIYAPSVTVQNLTVDGNAGVGGAGSYNFHQGITTLYDLQGGSNYSSEYNGSLAPNHLVAAGANTGSVTVQNVTVQNTWYKGITLSDVSGESFQYVYAKNNTVTNVGTGSLTTAQWNDRTGIMLANVDNAIVRGNTISNVGVGVSTGVFGPTWLATGSPNAPTDSVGRNKSGVAFNTVTDAVSRGYSIVYQDNAIDSNILLSFNSDFRYGFIGNSASWSNSSNTATGIYFSYSQPYVMGGTITKAHIGVEVQNSDPANTVAGTPDVPALTGLTFVGPGSGVAGSIGILVDNTAASPNSATVIVGGGVQVKNYETGVSVIQNVAAADSKLNQAQLGSLYLSGNTVGVAVGAGSQADGNTFGPASGSPAATDPFNLTAGSTFTPGFPSNGFTANATTDNANTATAFTPPNADVLNVGNVTLASGSTYAPLLTGLSGSHDLFNFNSSAASLYTSYPGVSNTYPAGSVPSPPSSGVTTTPYGGTGILGGLQQGTADGLGGALQISGVNANNGAGFPLWLEYLGPRWWLLPAHPDRHH